MLTTNTHKYVSTKLFVQALKRMAWIPSSLKVPRAQFDKTNYETETTKRQLDSKITKIETSTSTIGPKKC